MTSIPKNVTSLKDAKEKAASYCAYQERSQLQVRNKLYEYGLHKDDVEQTISFLITEGFINEERFAKSYVRGKFRIKKWGRVKIMSGLRQHNISEYCVRKGFEEIEYSEYIDQLTELLRTKSLKIYGKTEREHASKLARYAVGKGYEANIVWELIEDMGHREKAQT